MQLKKHPILTLTLWYLPVALVQYFSAKASIDSISPWYDQLEKASWTPPAWIFGPVWTLLYLMMAVAAWLVYRAKNRHPKAPAYTAFFVQLFFNGLWSPLFFRYHLIGWAFADLILLFISILVTTLLFFKISKLAGWFFLPYLFWAGYALSLNWAIYTLN